MQPLLPKSDIPTTTQRTLGTIETHWDPLGHQGIWEQATFNIQQPAEEGKAPLDNGIQNLPTEGNWMIQLYEIRGDMDRLAHSIKNAQAKSIMDGS
jgi:hypothetical protein